MPHTYDPNQPRIPAGHHDGGQWTGDGDGEPTVQQALVFKRPPIVAPYTRPVLPLPDTGPAAAPPDPQNVDAVLAWYAEQSARNTPDRRAIVTFKARDYYSPEKGTLDWHGILTRSEASDVCRGLERVQTFVDRGVLSVGPKESYFSAATYGTAVHKYVEKEVNKRGNPDFRAEVSFAKIAEEDPRVYRGMRDSIRIDVYEKTKDGTVCVYDVKTGRSGMTIAHMNEIAWRVMERDGPRRIIVMEVKPSQFGR